MPRDGTRPEFELALKHAMHVCIASLSAASSASALRWFNVLVAGTSTATTHEIGASCVKVLLTIANELAGRWTPQSAILRSRFGLYGLPFEPELFDTELPTGLANVMRSSSSGQHSQFNTSVQDLKKMCTGGTCWL